MSVLVEDTPRNNLAAWTSDAFSAGIVRGAILSPFSTPSVGNSYKPSGARIAEQLHEVGCEVWFDPATHALQMPGVGDFRYYDGWDLWGGSRDDLLSRGLQRDHVRRVFEIQEALGAPQLGPSVLLTSPAGAQLALAYSLAEEALETSPSAHLTLAGTPTFWSGGDDLDAFVGAIAQLGAPGYFLIVVRPTSDLPVGASTQETAGLCRTARSLQQFGFVHISHGDLAALPAVAAGATSLGSGWDSRQRVCSFTSYEPREPGGGGGWFKRPTFRGLFGLLTRAEAERLVADGDALATRLHPGDLHPDAPQEAFTHHASCLRRMVEELSQVDFEERYRVLEESYVVAQGDWPLAAEAASMTSMADGWISPLLTGLRSYGQTEGWE